MVIDAHLAASSPVSVSPHLWAGGMDRKITNRKYLSAQFTLAPPTWPTSRRRDDHHENDYNFRLARSKFRASPLTILFFQIQINLAVLTCTSFIHIHIIQHISPRENQVVSPRYGTINLMTK